MLIIQACSLAADASQASDFGRAIEKPIFTDVQNREIRLAMVDALQQVSYTREMLIGCNSCSALIHS